MTTGGRCACIFAPTTKTTNELIKSQGSSSGGSTLLEMGQELIDKMIIVCWWSTIQDVLMSWRGGFPVKIMGERRDGKRSAMSTGEVFNISIKQSLSDKIRISD